MPPSTLHAPLGCSRPQRACARFAAGGAALRPGGCLLPTTSAGRGNAHQARASGPNGASKGPTMQELSAGPSPAYSAPQDIQKPKYVARPVPQPKTVSFFDAMKFGGPAPEVINGRLAMVGFLATAANELQHRGTIEEQLLGSPVPVAIFVLVTVYATLVPIMKGVKNEAFGPMSPRAETTNGRAAMLAFMVMLVLEQRTGIPFF
mmetsp:Transcript_15706/g.39938  ORF Transcript_15706/g.39938 Transcript_15706/m.39938 type:complete len:205 (-) Transcript_15706:133-747(-)